MEKYPLLARRNIPAYLVVASLWIGCAAVMAFALRTWSDAAVPWSVGAVWSLLASETDFTHACAGGQQLSKQPDGT